jgi:hypothetical protein
MSKCVKMKCSVTGLETNLFHQSNRTDRVVHIKLTSPQKKLPVQIVQAYFWELFNELRDYFVMIKFVHCTGLWCVTTSKLKLLHPTTKELILWILSESLCSYFLQGTQNMAAWFSFTNNQSLPSFQCDWKEQTHFFSYSWSLSFFFTWSFSFPCLRIPTICVVMPFLSHINHLGLWFDVSSIEIIRMHSTRF